MGKTSKVWEYSKRLDENSVQCNLCEVKLSAKGGNTSTVRHHLIGTHHIDVDGKGNSNSTPSVASFFGAKPKLSKSRKVEIDRKIAQFIAQDGRPISIVEGNGFRSLIQFLEPDYEVKSRKTTTVLITERYAQGVTELKSMLGNAEYVAFTTDMWTSIQNIAYMCVTVHWLNPEWNLKSAVLQTREVPERHTGENISLRLVETANEWQIPVKKIAATVHDNGANINLAINILEDWPDQRCFAHTLQLAVGAGLKGKAIDKMLVAARRLAAHFKRSTVAAQALRERQQALQSEETEEVPVSEVIIDCSTRWNSSLDMLERLVKLRWAIGAVLSDPSLTVRSHASTLEMTDENWTLAQAIIPILQPFKLITTMSSRQSYPSLSTVYPYLFIILKNITVSKQEEHSAVKQCRKTISDELKRRYYPKGYSTLNAAKATVYDPRYKLLRCFDAQSRNETYAAIRSELETIEGQTFDNESEVFEPEPPPKKARRELDCRSTENIFQDLAALCTADESAPTSDELTAYLSETPLSVNADILQYWRDNYKRYPKLSSLARKYLCIPATSVPSESAFSTAGHIVNRKRASLAPETVDMLTFLNRNWNVCVEFEK